MSDALARNGAFVAPRDEVELVETFDPDTGRSLDVEYVANANARPALPRADFRIV
jgi:hypothetical protein